MIRQIFFPVHIPSCDVTLSFSYYTGRHKTRTFIAWHYPVVWTFFPLVSLLSCDGEPFSPPHTTGHTATGIVGPLNLTVNWTGVFIALNFLFVRTLISSRLIAATTSWWASSPIAPWRSTVNRTLLSVTSLCHTVRTSSTLFSWFCNNRGFGPRPSTTAYGTGRPATPGKLTVSTRAVVTCPDVWVFLVNF